MCLVWKKQLKRLLIYFTCKIVNCSGDLKSQLVWILNGRKEVGLQMVRILNGIWNLEAQPFEIRINGCHFIKNHLKSGQNCTDFEWFGFWMVGTRAIDIGKAQPFENRTIWNQTFKKSGFWMFSDFKWSDFRSPLYVYKIEMMN